MQTITKVALDAMGGDNAPVEIVKGAVDAVLSRDDIKVFLVGQEDAVRDELNKYEYPKEQIEIVDAPEIIEMAEPPVQAIRKKKQSSMVIGMNMVKQKEADAFVSAGSSGAVLVGGQTIVGRIKGIKRPPLAPMIPTETGVSLLIDCGANVDARPEHLLQLPRWDPFIWRTLLVWQIRVWQLSISVRKKKREMHWSRRHFLYFETARILISSEVLKPGRFLEVERMLSSVKRLWVM